MAVVREEQVGCGHREASARFFALPLLRQDGTKHQVGSDTKQYFNSSSRQPFSSVTIHSCAVDVQGARVIVICNVRIWPPRWI
jgi:hypothetical protein